MKRLMVLGLTCLALAGGMAGVAVIGCQPHAVRNLSYADYLTYLKDERTHLCFAAFGLGTQAAVLTNVPCSTEVEEEIKKVQDLQRMSK